MKKFYETPAVECRMVEMHSILAGSTTPGDKGGDVDPYAVKARPTTYGAPAQFDF